MVFILNFAAVKGHDYDMETLFRQHFRPLCLYALHYLEDADDAEDVVQECFLSLWQSKPDNPKPWLYTAVRNRCIDRLRSHRSFDSFPEDLAEELSFDEIVSRSEREARLWSAVEALPEQRRRCLIMAKRDNMSYSEIASELGLSENTVRNNISRALKTLRGAGSKDLLFILSFF